MKKTLDTAEIESQLAGSVFFRKDKSHDLQGARQAAKAERPQTGKSATQKEATSVKPRAVEEKELDRTVTPNERTDEPNGDTERLSVLTELEEGVRETKRPTERYSFEIYTDMKEKIEDIQYQYKKKTGKKLSASRMIREALAVYFRQIEEAI